MYFASIDTYKNWALLFGILLLCCINKSNAQNAKKYNTDYIRYSILKTEQIELVLQEHFDYEGKPKPENWNHEYGFVRNQELQWYQPQNAFCKNGHLIIEAKRERINNPNYYKTAKDWRNLRKYAEYTYTFLITK